MTIRAFRLDPESLQPLSPSEAFAQLAARGARVWIDLTIDDLPALEPQRALLPGHPLSWEDAATPQQRPKFEDHGDHLFVIVRSLDTSHDWLGMQLQTQQMACFVTPNLIVTVADGQLHAIRNVPELLSRRAAKLAIAPDGVLHALLDAIVDAYVPHMDRWEEEVERLDQEALRDPKTEVLARILAIRKHVVRLRRLAATQSEILAELSRGREGLVVVATRPYFKDVHDHLVSVRETADSLRDSVAIAVDIYLNSVNNRLNQIMKVLTLMSALMLPLSFVTGVFGMNFAFMPGIRMPNAFWWTIASMVIMASLMLMLFRRYKML